MDSFLLALALTGLGLYLCWSVWSVGRDFKLGRARAFWPWGVFIYRDQLPGAFWAVHVMNVLRFVLIIGALAVIAFVKPGGGFRF